MIEWFSWCVWLRLALLIHVPALSLVLLKMQIDAHDGTLQGVFSLSRSGAQAVEFTHHQSSVLHSAHHGPKQGPGIISYHCLHTNKILRLFNLHKSPVTSLAMNPGNDQFMSVSLDGVCALWDIRSPNCEVSGWRFRH